MDRRRGGSRLTSEEANLDIARGFCKILAEHWLPSEPTVLTGTMAHISIGRSSLTASVMFPSLR